MDLRSVNNIPPRMLIKAGSTLLVPRSGKIETDVAVNIADNAQMTLSPDVVTRRTTVKSRKGDTVALIAKRYNLSAANVAMWNSASNSTVFKQSHPVVLFLPLKNHVGKSRVNVKVTKLSNKKQPIKKKPR